MKKLLSIVLVLGFYVYASAQTEPETLNWLDQNKKNLDLVYSQAYDLYGDFFEITEDYVRLYDNEKSCKVLWKDVKNITSDDDYFYLNTDNQINNKNISMTILIANKQNRNDFKNAIQKMVDFKKSSSNIVKN